MRTAEEFYDYCVQNNYGQGMTRSWGIKHFQLIVDALQPDENVQMCFIGLHNFRSATKHDQNFAYAVTNKRIIMAQKKLVGQIIQSVSLANVNDITYSSGMLMGIITVDTIKEKFNVGVNKAVGDSINSVIHTVLNQIMAAPSPVPASNSMDQLVQLKSFLDSGIITQADFDAKKRQILGI